ncbi:MAG: ribosomal protein S18 acetylase RimI-like enzyme [Paraglaciecola sp.]|jgi:ribosomal protein S18 acetylase RimI-like enzyme
MNIQNSKITDIDEIFRLYGIASAYQKSKKTVVVWPAFERSMVEREIKGNHQWKLIIDGQVACVWATAFSDEQIWEARNVDSAIYIHRIATNPDFRGQNFVKIIVDWAKEHTKALGKDYVRLDTIGHNEKLIAHYVKGGFDFLGMFELNNTDGLPAHYQSLPAALFQLKV